VGPSPNMSGKPLWNPDKVLDKADWDLAAEELGLGQTCPIQELDMSSKGYWNLTWDPNKSG
jgi:hypothetical protein